MAKSKRHSSLSLSSLITLFKCCLLARLAQVAAGMAGPNDVYSMAGMSWDHAVDLNEDFRILWTHINQDITFEIQARTMGYVGFGFSADGQLAGTDIAIGWVDDGQTFFQDRYVAADGAAEPRVDPSQDYILMMGYENATHTVIRFRRKLQTCDEEHDVQISNDTMRVFYMYGMEDPKHSPVGFATLPNAEDAWRSPRSLVLTQRPVRSQHRHDRVLELKNENVELPFADDTLTHCHVFKLDKVLKAPNWHKKFHMTRFEPLFDSSWALHYMQQIVLYECQDDGFDLELEQLSRESGRACAGARSVSQQCNAVAAVWSRGSEGFSYPKEAGYPLDAKSARYFLMETQYYNPKLDFEQLDMPKMYDSSGLRIYFTDHLRAHDAGMMSIGMEPSWRHIIPPGQRRVVSEGQCLEDCTAYAFPAQGISIFGVLMHTHQIGREMKLRHIRDTEELAPIAHDKHIDSEFHEIRPLDQHVRALPGDRLVAECIYDSSGRAAITLGGATSMKMESCTVYTMYYPRQYKLSSCLSLPSLPTVLHSLGIEKLATNLNPIVIASPAELAGQTLESRLLSYDWKHQFDIFQRKTLEGSFKPVCRGLRSEMLPISDNLMGYRVELSKKYTPPRHCKPRRLFVKENTSGSHQVELPVLHDLQSNHIFVSGDNGSARSSRSSFIETLALSAAPPNHFPHYSLWLLWLLPLAIVFS
ncbi:MOXD1 homolog 2-like [Scaptodrosophila lebanonensis]|uniref:MOXD1 homolog 2-like n=1 Tax=Drosophila lebanonensis TaxID=7225 RepID=A0A6J2THE8_DROLE|nr:MOXD1 homolog 2-like [Scaptodrosophila lebanonensis]